MGAHRSDGGRDWLQQDGPEQPDHPEQSPVSHRTNIRSHDTVNIFS